MTDVEYLNSSVWATLRPSKIDGIGVIAIRDIPKGTKITEYSIHYIKETRLCSVSLNEFDLILPEIKSIILDRNLFQEWQTRFHFYSPNNEQTLQSFCNHSNDPNSAGMIALRDINKGEEITLDYRKMFNGKNPHPLITKHHAY